MFEICQWRLNSDRSWRNPSVRSGCLLDAKMSDPDACGAQEGISDVLHCRGLPWWHFCLLPQRSLPYLSVFILHLYMEVDGLKYEATWSDSRVTVSAATFGTRHHARQSACYRRPRRCQGADPCSGQTLMFNISSKSQYFDVLRYTS